jgi:excisionase family DNA binding protein
MESTRDFVDAGEASRLVGLDRSTLYRLARDGRVRSFRILDRVRFERSDLLALIKERPSNNVPRSQTGRRTRGDHHV